MAGSGGVPRGYRAAWWAVAVPAGVIGAAGFWLDMGAGSALVLLAGSAVLGTLGVWQFGPQRGEGRPGPADGVVGTAAALGLLAIVGLTYEFGAAGFAAGTVLAAAGWPLRRRRTQAPAAAVPAGPELEQVPEAPLPDSAALREVSTAQLCWTWRASYALLHRYPWPSYQECLADLRRACLDELERRDPAAFARWFPTARAAGDPARYFCRESQR